MFKLIRFLMIASAFVIASFDGRATVPVTPPPTTDSSPDCSGAAASLGVIWPPNHTMVAVTIAGVTDPYNLPVSIAITGIQQDEPINALGSGNTAPDGSGIGTSTAMVRAERAGPGSGRIYFIAFTATNGIGLQCTGTVEPFVPHDQGQGFTPVDTGLRFDSTVVPD